MTGDEEQDVCFVIGPIGDPGSDERNRADDVLEGIIRPAAKECGYVVARADEIAQPGIITSQILEYLCDAAVVVVDLTGQNANVLCELGVRLGLGKPFVLVAEDGENLPFDIAALRVIFFDSKSLRSGMSCRQELAKQMRYAGANPDMFRRLFGARSRRRGSTSRRVRRPRSATAT